MHGVLLAIYQMNLKWLLNSSMCVFNLNIKIIVKLSYDKNKSIKIKIKFK